MTVDGQLVGEGLRHVIRNGVSDTHQFTRKTALPPMVFPLDQTVVITGLSTLPTGPARKGE